MSDALPIQIRQQKHQWDTGSVPKGKIQDIIKNFSRVKKREEPELINTGKRNRFMVHNDQQRGPDMEQLTRADYEEKMRKAAIKREAAIKLQSAVRRMKAQKIRKRKEEAAAAKRRKAEEDRLRAEQEARDRAREEEERAKMDAEERARREQEEKERAERDAIERARLDEEERKRKEEQARFAILNDERTMAAIKIQAMVRSALTRIHVRIYVEKLIEDMIKAQAEAEERERLEAEQAHLREQRRRAFFKKHGLFCGPIEPEVGLLTDWWMENVPHKTYHQEDFDDAMNKLWEQSLEQRFFVFGILTQAKQESLLGGHAEVEPEERDIVDGLLTGNHESQRALAVEPEETFEEVSVVDEIYYSDDGFAEDDSLPDESEEELEVFEDE